MIAATKRAAAPTWPRWLALWCFVQCSVVGWWLQNVRNYAIKDSLFRTLYAKQMVFSRDPHLGAMGFYWMPLPTWSRIPFVILAEPFHQAILAGPMTSAFFAAASVLVLARLGAVLKLSTSLTAVICVVYVLSPITVYMGANGMSESTFACFLLLTILGFLRWRNDGRTNSLVLFGLALGGAMMTRFETLVLLPVLGIVVALCAERGRRVAQVIIALAPAVVVFAWWTLASSLIMDDALYWWHTANAGTTSTPAAAAWLPSDRGLLSLATYTGLVLLALAPSLVLSVVGAATVPRRWRTSIGVLGATLAIPAVVTVQMHGGSSWGVPRFYVLTPVLAIACVMWVLRAGADRPATRTLGYLGVAALVIGSITGSLLLSTRRYAYAEGEFAFFGPLLGKSTVQPFVPEDGPDIVYAGDLRPYRDLRRELDPLLAAGSLAATQSLSVPLLLSDHPDRFIAPEDRDFERITSDPAGRFDFIVLLTWSDSAGHDVLDAIAHTSYAGGEWVQVRDVVFAVVYEWVPTGDAPLLAPPPSKASDP